MINFRDSNKSFKLEGDPLKLITNYKFNANHSSPQDKKLNYEFAKEMNYDTKSIGRPSIRQNFFYKNTRITIYYGLWSYNNLFVGKS